MNRTIACIWLLSGLLPLGIALAPGAVFAQQPKFEISDVHPRITARLYVQSFGGVVRQGLYINRDATMLDLIKGAYGISDEDIAGGPGWASYDLFGIVAKVPAGTTPATANLMLQSLLSDRFGLVVQRETRPVPRCVLTLVKNGSKLKSADPSETPGCKSLMPPGVPTPNAKMGGRNLTAAAPLRKIFARWPLLIWITMCSTRRSPKAPGTSISNGRVAARSPPREPTASSSSTLSNSYSV